MPKMTLLPSIVSLAVLFSGATWTPGPVSPDPGLEAPFEDGCTGCRTCYGVSYWHNTNYAPPLADYSGPQHLCQMGNCGDHGICGGEEETQNEVALVDELEAIRRAFQYEGPKGLRKVLEESSSRVAVNRTRMAVQVTGCSGGIVAHFPLTERYLAAVTN
jgi:hypothetical protein